MNTRTQRATQMMELPNCAVQFSPERFSVRSQSIPQIHYIVSKTSNGLICDCPDHTKRKSDCKHIKTVLELIRNNEGQEQTFRIIEGSLVKVCKFCDSGNIIKKGIKKNKSGSLQKFKCNDCKRGFTANFGFEKMRYSNTVITRALQMYFSGMSVRDIADCFEQEEIKVSYRAVYGWIEKYSKTVADYVKGIVPRVSETWRTDEIFMKIKGNMKLQYSMLDHETRFMITQFVADTKGTENVRPMFKEAQLFDGFQTFYNFSKKHGGIEKKTPAEMAGILVDGSNKWKTIIQNASLNQHA